jgi:hypothetical protein
VLHLQMHTVSLEGARAVRSTIRSILLLPIPNSRNFSARKAAAFTCLTLPAVLRECSNMD